MTLSWPNSGAKPGARAGPCRELVETALRNLFRSQKSTADLAPLPVFHSGASLVDIADRDLYRTMEDCYGGSWEQTSGSNPKRPGALDALPLPRTVHRLPKVIATLDVQPKVRAVAENPGKDEGSGRRHTSAIATKLVHMLALNAHCFGQGSLGQSQGLHELLRQDFANRRWLALRHQHERLVHR